VAGNEVDLVDIILDIHKDVATLKSDTSYIKYDLREHMKRTAQMETEVKYLHRQINLAHGAIAFITIFATAISIWKHFS
jgi:hypothetical protein